MESLHSHLDATSPAAKKRSTLSKMHIFPVTRKPFFPGMAAPLVIEPGQYYEILKAISKTDNKFIGLALTKDENADIYNLGLDDLFPIGIAARILRIIPIEQGGAQIILNMESRIEIAPSEKNGKKKQEPSKKLYAKVRFYKDSFKPTEELKAYSISIISTIKELLKLNPIFKDELQVFLNHSDFTEPGKLADFSAALTTASRTELQDILETIDIPSRINKALILLKNELDISQLHNGILQKIESTVGKAQKEFYLREQMKNIKKELGLDKDDKSSDRDKFAQRLQNKMVPEEIKATIQDELEKLSNLEPQSPEYGLSRNYLDWLTCLPWGHNSLDVGTLEEARNILERGHYGLKDLKKRIIECISVGKKSGTLKGTILCLVGPPGVGKTSIGKSIAEALNRKFFRFSVGGMRDEAEIKGHRRTYIGAMPGKIIQALKTCQTMNPVIMLDEVDKIGSNYFSDPSSALLEVLDPEQNSEFLDHYLDVRVDLSEVLFIVTANVLDSIPEPLLDRMDVLRLSGYILEEKVEIARQYLIPKQKKLMGLLEHEIRFNSAALRALIENYAREAGVRGLENNIKKILRQITVPLVEEMEKQSSKNKKKSTEEEEEKVITKSRIQITPSSLHTYLGKPLFQSDRYYKITPPGVVVGLAWTAMGGATLYVETIKVATEKTEMKLTGHAGQVMRESSEIAWSYAQSAVERYLPGRSFFEKQQVHIHFPEGATPKDGPSAGITIVTALFSLLLNIPAANNLAMTGELTLTGQVLPIGGVKEKLIAAKRSGITKVLLPKGNIRDFDELPPIIKENIEIVFVDHYDQVFKNAFPSITS
ncbi:MAG: endopeptidase La [Chlamydia sp.]